MCGIVGYIGKRDALPILMNGIKKLEYRGYDSAGIMIVDKNNNIFFKKSVGDISFLENKIRETSVSGNVGMAHSRWATHGGVTELNAHPHFSCDKNIWISHNGIIENYKELYLYLKNKGHKFISQTDTEVLAHLIEEIKKEKKLNIIDSVREALKIIKGTYGIVVIDREMPNILIAARNFSPLLIGVGNNEYFVASDASAIISHTRDVVYLKDEEYAVISNNGYDIFNLDNNLIKKDIHKIDWDIESVKKDGFPHFMLKEIYSQPESIMNSIRGRIILDEGKAKLGGLDPIKSKIRDIEKLHIVGCGTSYLAGKVGEYMLEEYAGIPVKVENGSEFRYKKPVFGKNDALIVISQSGETADSLAAVKEAKEKGILSLGIVNVVGSTISRETDAGVYQHIGPEISVASTKAFTSQVSILALFTLFFGRQRDMSLVIGKRIAQELVKLPRLAESIIQNSSENIKKIAKKYKKYKNFLYLGRKYNFATALEGALKIKEISYIHAEGISAGEMKHGPIAMIDNNFPTVFVSPNDSVYKKNISNMQEIKARGGPIIAITTNKNKEISKIADDVIFIPKTLEMLTPILAVIPLQLFAYYFAVNKGLNVDMPRNLAKSVTVE